MNNNKVDGPFWSYTYSSHLGKIKKYKQILIRTPSKKWIYGFSILNLILLFSSFFFFVISDTEKEKVLTRRETL